MKIIAALYCMTVVWSLNATNRYVSTTGNDSHPGTFDMPWRNIQKAANEAQPGDTVFIRGGTYTENVWMNVGGAPGNWIVFKNYESEVVKLDGGTTGAQTELLVILGFNYLKIIGLEFQNAIGNNSAGIYIGNGASHIHLIGNSVHDIHFSTDPNATVTPNTNTYPIVVYNQNPSTACMDILMDGNEVFDCRTGYSEGIKLSGNVDGFALLNNSVHDITNIGIDIAGGYGVSPNPANDMARNGIVRGNYTYECVSNIVSAGIYVDGGHDVVIEHNYSYRNGRGIEVGCEQQGHVATNITVRNNWVYDNDEAGIGIGGYNYPITGKVTASEILNNSLFANNTTNNYDGELLVEYTENCSVQNNSFYAVNNQNLLLVTRENSTGLILDYNNYFLPAGAATAKVDYEGSVITGFANYQTSTGQDLHSSFANPLYTNPGAFILNLNGNSPCINAGNPAFVPAVGEVDIQGEPRMQHILVDVGADEANCPTDLNLSGNLPAGIYQISGNLTSNGLAAAGANVVFKASTILLDTGFAVDLGTYFLAEHDPCN